MYGILSFDVTSGIDIHVTPCIKIDKPLVVYSFDFNNRNLFLTAKSLKQGYRYHKIRKAFSKFYHRHSELIVKYNIG